MMKDEVEKKRAALREELKHEVERYGRHAHLQEVLLGLSFYVSMAFGGLAVAAGLIKSPYLPSCQ
jgi:hypothetical protein